MRRVRIGGATVAVDDDKPTFWDRVDAGAWEPGTLAVYEDLVRPGTWVLDLGAWIGPLALLAAAMGARVIAVEADPAALRQLDSNLAANPELASRIAVQRCAVAATAGTAVLGPRRKPGDSMSSTLLAGQAGSWSVEARTPQDLAGPVPAGAPLLIKLDIEGGEYALLPALRPLLDRPATALLASFHPAFLRESAPTQAATATERALTPFGDLRVRAVTAAGLQDLPITRDAVERHDTWLWESRSRPLGSTLGGTGGLI